MRIYFAPLETITGYLFRMEHNKYFQGIDKYFIPFISPTMNGLSKKEMKEIEPKNNQLSAIAIPQILSKNAKETLDTIIYLEKLGYQEVNLNFGCPSQTVVPKGKGGGMLEKMEVLDLYLKEIFDNTKCKISIKLRLGISDISEFDNILKVLNKYPIHELIIHARTVKEYYKGTPHLEILQDLNKKTSIDIIYNGDVKSKEDINYLKENYPFLKGIMIGRGLIARPDLLEEESTDKVYQFYKELVALNRLANGNNNSLFYEKELLFYLLSSFDCPKTLYKKIFKVTNSFQMDSLIENVFNTCQRKKSISSFSKDYE